MYNKKKSPNKFMAAGMAASLGAIGRSGNGQSVMSAGMQAAGLNQQQMSNSFIAGGPGGLFEAAKAAQAAQGMGAVPSTGVVGAAPQVSQAAQAAQAAVNEGATMGVGNPLSGTGGPAGSSNPFGGQKFEITPVQMTYETPIPGNERGNANPLFNESVTNAGNMMFGDVSQRQRSLQNQAGDIQATQYVKDPSTLQGNAFGLAMDQSEGDYDKAKEIIKNK